MIVARGEEEGDTVTVVPLEIARPANCCVDVKETAPEMQFRSGSYSGSDRSGEHDVSAAAEGDGVAGGDRQ